MRKIRKPSIGQYVLVSKSWYGCPYDPWHLGFIKSVLVAQNRKSKKFEYKYFVEGSWRQWNHCRRLTKEEGHDWYAMWYGKT